MLSEDKNIKMGVILSYCEMAISIIGALFVSNRVLFLIGDYNYGLWSFVCSITSWLTVVSAALTSSYLRFATREAVDNNGDTSRTNGVFFSMLSILGLVIFILGTIVVLFLQLNKIPFASYSWEDSQILYILFFISIIDVSVSMPTCIYLLILNYNKKFAEYRRKNEYSPIEFVTGRVKEVSSMLEKANKFEIPIDRIRYELEDIAGKTKFVDTENHLVIAARDIGVSFGD